MILYAVCSRNFPFDTQTCELVRAANCPTFYYVSFLHFTTLLLLKVFESYSFNAEEVRLKWFDKDPVAIPNKIELPDFDLVDFRTEKQSVEYPNGLWDRLVLTLTFERRYGFYILQVISY